MRIIFYSLKVNIDFIHKNLDALKPLLTLKVQRLLSLCELICFKQH